MLQLYIDNVLQRKTLHNCNAITKVCRVRQQPLNLTCISYYLGSCSHWQLL